MEYHDILGADAMKVMSYAIELRDPGTPVEAALQLLAALGTQRADIYGRAPLPVDMEFIGAMVCWWPFKTVLPTEVIQQVVTIRAEMLNLLGRLELQRVVPEDVLALSYDELTLQFQTGAIVTTWQRFALGEIA